MAVEEINENGGHLPISLPPLSTTTEHLTFDPQVFTQPDFNVDKLMDNIRRQSDLKEVDKQLRGILQHFQYGLINLINNDYTQFVELSSRLVALNKAVESLEAEHDESWEDYNTFAKKISELYSFFEKQQRILSESRAKESWNVNELNVYLILDDIVKTGKKTSHGSIEWLKFLKNRLVYLNIYLKALEAKDPDKFEHLKISIQNHLKYVRNSLSSSIPFNPNNLQLNYHMLLNVTEMDMADEALQIAASRICSNLRLSDSTSLTTRWNEFLEAVSKPLNEIKNIEHSSLPELGKASLQKFYLSALLTYVFNFSEEHFQYDFIPTQLEPFENCFTRWHEFCEAFPDRSTYAYYLKKVTSLFDPSIYLKLRIQKEYSAFMDAAVPENVKNDVNALKDVCKKFLDTVDVLARSKLPNCNYEMLQLFGDLISNFFDFCDEIKDIFSQWNAEQQDTQQDISDSNNRWQIMFAVKGYMNSTISAALDRIIKLLLSNAISNSVDFESLLKNYRKAISINFQGLEVKMEAFLNTRLNKTIVYYVSMVGNVPKKYRWTKLALPTEASDYVNSVKNIYNEMKQLSSEINYGQPAEAFSDALIHALETFIAKANEVLDTVDKTANILRQKGKSTTLDANDSDESKMKRQICLDAEAFALMVTELKGAEFATKLKELSTRAADE